MAQLYLNLLKKSLLGELHWENEVRVFYLRDCLEGRETYSPHTLLRIDDDRAEMCQRYCEMSREGRFLDNRVENTGYRHTMIGRLRLDNLASCMEKIRRMNVPGDVVECGVWRGGAAIFLRGFLKAYGITDRTVWVADSFAGIPPPTLPQDQGYDLSAARFPMFAVPEERVRELFARYDLLDDQVRFLPGWFRDTLPAAPIESLALLRIDGDLYESTTDALNALYPKLSAGGFVIVDDYYCVRPCRQAVEDYRRKNGIDTPLEQIDWTGVFWQKSSSPVLQSGMRQCSSTQQTV